MRWTFLFLVVFQLYSNESLMEELEVKQVVIWGHKLHSHTHSYIHQAFYTAFSHLGYPTNWFDNNDDVNGFDFAHTLFITEGQVDQNIPIREDCKYILHNCNDTKYHSIPMRNCISLQVFTNDVLKVPKICKVEPFIYYDFESRSVYMPWASDLLPHEIEEMKKNIPNPLSSNQIIWVGTVGDGMFGNIHQINPYIEAAKMDEVIFVQRGGLKSTDHVSLVRSGYMAPTIVGKWQKDVGYIPCRIFKNISYGKMGITNSKEVYELFEGKVVYNPDTFQLYSDAKERLTQMEDQDLYDLMDFVKDRHTYINRIHNLLDFFTLVNRETL